MRRVSQRWLVTLFVACVACGSSAAAPGGGPSTTPPSPEAPTVVCAEGFQPIDGAAGCEPTLPTAGCLAGTTARIGSATCVPVGVTSCAKGFAAHASGWGCDAVLPPEACPAGTRERLGDRACAPVTDCNAPFPPAGATLFVKATYAPTELDASHFLTVSEALAVAPAGATIAVDAGTYAEKLTPKTRVTIVGRCAEQVVFSSVDGTGPGLRIEKVDVDAENLTFRGFRGGIASFGSKTSLRGVVVEDSILSGISASETGTVVTLSNVVVRGTRLAVGNNQSFGLVAQNGAKLEVDDSVLSDNDFANVVATGPGVSARVSRSVIRDGRPPVTGSFSGSFGVGLYVSNGASASIEECAVTGNAADGIVVAKGTPTSAVASATVARSVVRDTKLDPVREIGRGIEVGNGSSLVVEQTTSFGNAEAELLVTDGGHADLRDTTTFGTAASVTAIRAGTGLLVSTSASATVRSLAVVSARGVGIQVQERATLEASDSLVLGTQPQPQPDAKGRDFGFGMTIKDGAKLTLTRSTIERATAIGLLVTGVQAKLDGVLVRQTRPSPAGAYGRGVSGQDGTELDINRSAFIDNGETGILLIDGAGILTLNDSTVANTHFDPNGRFGLGVLLSGGVKATLTGSTITGSQGPGVASAGSGARLVRATLSRNAVALHVQDGASLVESDTDASDPLAVVVSRDTAFVDNGSRVGTGTIPLPTVLEAAP